MIGLSNPSSVPLSFLRYQRSYLWDVLLPDITGNVTNIASDLIGAFAGFGVAQFAQRVDFGDYNITNLSTMRYGPYQANFAGLFEVGKVRITFLKPMPDVVSMYFHKWKELIIDSKGLYYPKVKYARNIYIRFIDQSSIAIGRYKLIGAFPTIFPSYNLSYEGNEVTKITIEFAVDKIEYEAL